MEPIITNCCLLLLMLLVPFTAFSITLVTGAGVPSRSVAEPQAVCPKTLGFQNRRLVHIADGSDFVTARLAGQGRL